MIRRWLESGDSGGGGTGTQEIEAIAGGARNTLHALSLVGSKVPRVVLVITAVAYSGSEECVYCLKFVAEIVTMVGILSRF